MHTRHLSASRRLGGTKSTLMKSDFSYIRNFSLICFTELYNQFVQTMPWNTMMDVLMKEMHAKGVTINDIAQVLRKAPIHPLVVPAIKAAHDAGCDLRIVSDANTFFIETILDHFGLKDYFSEINTNPSYLDEEGRLRILPYHDFIKSPHGCCNPCPPNLCKGLVIKRLLSENVNKKFIYLGDGSGDYCPCLRLREGDHVMPRKNFPLSDLILSNPMLITAMVHEWADGEDLERVLLSTIQAINSNEGDHSATQSLKVDCKLETLPSPSPSPIASRKAICQTLCVP